MIKTNSTGVITLKSAVVKAEVQNKMIYMISMFEIKLKSISKYHNALAIF